MGDEVLRLRSEDLDWREIEGEIVALDGKSSVYLGLNQTGRLIWQRLADGATRQELIGALCAEFEVDADTAAHHLDAFLAELTERGLLECPEGPQRFARQ